MKSIESERILLRMWELNDANDFFYYAKNPKIGPQAGWKPHRSIMETYEIIHNFIQTKEVWAIVHKKNNKVIGSIGLHKDIKRPLPYIKSIGYVLSEDYWGRGLATEAVKRVIQYVFTETDISVLTAYHFPDNLLSKRVIEKCGFNYEGTIQLNNLLYYRTSTDTCFYSLNKDEYLQLTVERV